jgi:hypothetical protein
VGLFVARGFARPSSRDRHRIRESIERALGRGSVSQTVLRVDASMAERALAGAMLTTTIYGSHVALAKLLIPAVLIGAGAGAIWARTLFTPHAQPEPTSRSLPAEVEDVGDDELSPSTTLTFDDARAPPQSIASTPIAASTAKPPHHAMPRHARARASGARPARPAAAVPPALTPAATQAESSPMETPSHHLAEELRLMRAASAALSVSDNLRTLSLLAQHAELFPDGALREEGRAMRVISLCKQGSSHFALVERDEFLSSSPRSLLSARVREACELPE